MYIYEIQHPKTHFQEYNNKWLVLVSGTLAKYIFHGVSRDS